MNHSATGSNAQIINILPLILEINYHNHHKLIDAMRLQINTFADHISKACFKKIHYVEIMPCTGKNILSCAKRGYFTILPKQ